MKLSYSSISEFKNCPKAFELRYIKNLEPEFKDSIYTIFGSVIHSIIENTFKNDKILELNEILNVFPDSFIKNLDKLENKSSVIIPQWLEYGKNCLKYFYDNYYNQIKPNFITAEQRFSYNVLDDVFFNGIVDLIYKYNTTINLIDWKTGKSFNECLQLRLYALVLYKQYGVLVNEIEYAFLKNQTSNKIKINEWMLQETELELLEITNKIIKTTKFEKKFSGLCKFCNVKHFCKLED